MSDSQSVGAVDATLLETIERVQNMNPIEELQAFLHQGGDVLWLVMASSFLLWWLVIERQYYFWKLHHNLVNKIVGYWQTRSDHHSWYAHKIRQRLISVAKIKVERNLAIIKAVVVIAPLLGLLGTVTGMIDVFEVMSTSNSSNTRAMAAGVSKATIPTMAGMVVALIGLLFDMRLQRKAGLCVDELAVQLQLSDKPLPVKPLSDNPQSEKPQTKNRRVDHE